MVLHGATPQAWRSLHGARTNLVVLQAGTTKPARPGPGKGHGRAGLGESAGRDSGVVVALVVVTLVVVTLVVVALVAYLGTMASSPVFRALRSTSLPSASTTLAFSRTVGERLAAGDLGHHRGDLAVLVDRLGELVGVHAVLLRPS